MTLELYRSPTYDDTTGTEITPLNNNNNSSITSGVVIRKDPSVSDDGTRTLGFLAGANKQAGLVDREHENVLLKNTTHLMKITSSDTGNNISWVGEWYES